MSKYKRIPKHIGIIPDGNRRWAQNNGLEKQDGYNHGISPGLQLFQTCSDLGVKEVTFYGFTQDNTKRPSVQTDAFRRACVDSVMKLTDHDANLLVVGNTNSPLFPKELLPFTESRVTVGNGGINVNFLVNYGWNWDLHQYNQGLASSEISRIDLIIRWGGRRRLSGFLPIQSIYADFYIVDDMWPDFQTQHVHDALTWYQEQDLTLGG